MTSPIPTLHAAVDATRAREAAIREAERRVVGAARVAGWNNGASWTIALLQGALASLTVLERGDADEGSGK